MLAVLAVRLRAVVAVMVERRTQVADADVVASSPLVAAGAHDDPVVPWMHRAAPHALCGL